MSIFCGWGKTFVATVTRTHFCAWVDSRDILEVKHPQVSGYDALKFVSRTPTQVNLLRTNSFIVCV